MVYKFTEPTKWIKLSVAEGFPLVQAKNKIFTCVWVSGGWQQWWHPGPDHSLTLRSDCRDIAGHTEGWDMRDLSRGTRYPAHYFSSSLNDQQIYQMQNHGCIIHSIHVSNWCWHSPPTVQFASQSAVWRSHRIWEWSSWWHRKRAMGTWVGNIERLSKNDFILTASELLLRWWR